MSVKWFSGGKERKNEAVLLLDSFIQEVASEANGQPLEQVLKSYREELVKESSSIPFILSRMNIAISKVLTDNQIELTTSQSDKLKELSKLSQIRYGY